MPTVVAGTLRLDQIAGQKIPVDMDRTIHFEETSAYRFEYFSRTIRPIQEVGNRKHEWMQHELYPHRMKVTATEAAAQTSITVDYPEYAHRDQMIVNQRTWDAVKMAEDTGGGTVPGDIKIVGLTGSGGLPSQWEINDILIVLPEVHAEGAALPPAFSSKPDFFYTFIQQSDQTLKYSDFAQEHDEYGMNQYLADLRQMWIYRKRQINLALLASKQISSTGYEATTDSGSARRYTARGFRDYVQTNRQDLSDIPGGLTLTSLGEMLRDTKAIGASSATKLGLSGTNAVQSLSALPINQIQTSVTEQIWGHKITTLVTPFGTLPFDWDESFSAENGLDDVFIIMDRKSVHRLRFRGAKFAEHMVYNVNDASDYHNTQTLFTGTWGLKVVHEDLNAWAYGIH